MQPFDTIVAQLVYRASLMERVLHASGRWSIAVGDFVVPALRGRVGYQITFLAYIPEWCWITRPTVARLLLDGDTICQREIEPSDAGFDLRWSFVLNVVAA